MFLFAYVGSAMHPGKTLLFLPRVITIITMPIGFEISTATYWMEVS